MTVPNDPNQPADLGPVDLGPVSGEPVDYQPPPAFAPPPDYDLEPDFGVLPGNLVPEPPEGAPPADPTMWSDQGFSLDAAATATGADAWPDAVLDPTRRMVSFLIWSVLAMLCLVIPFLEFYGVRVDGVQILSVDGWGVVRADPQPGAVVVSGASHDTVYGFVFVAAAAVLGAAAVLMYTRAASPWASVLGLLGGSFLVAVVCVLLLDVSARASFQPSRTGFTSSSGLEATRGPGVSLSAIAGVLAALGVALAVSSLRTSFRAMPRVIE